MGIGARIARGSLLLSMGSIISLLIAAIGSIVIARTLGPENYGLIPVIMIAPNILMVLSDLGLSTALTRYTSIGGSPYVLAGFTLKVLSGALASIALVLIADYVALALDRPVISHYIRLTALLVLANSIVSASTAILVGLGRYTISASLQVILTTIRVMAAILLVLAGFGILGAVLGHVIAWSFIALLSLVLISSYLSPITRPSSKVVREILAYSIPLYLPSLLGIPLGQFYYSILVRVSSNWDLGNLGVASNIMAPLGSVGGAIATSLISSLPLLLGDRDGLTRTLERALAYTSLIMPALGGAIIVVSEPVLLTLYGQEYYMAPLYASAMALGVMLAPLGSYIWGAYMASIGKTTELLKAQILGAIIGIPVYVSLTLTAGVLGYVASGIIVSLITTLYLLRVALSLGVRVNILESFRMIAPTIIALTTTIPLMAVKDPIVRWLLAPLVYGVTLAIVTPVIVGFNTMTEMANTMRSVGFIGAMIALAINIDVKIAEKIWGLRRV